MTLFANPSIEYELKLRVINQLNIMKALRLQSRLNIELHDETTGKHIIRVGKFSGLLARKLSLPHEVAYMIEKAAPMHDIGKIMISSTYSLSQASLMMMNLPP